MQVASTAAHGPHIGTLPSHYVTISKDFCNSGVSQPSAFDVDISDMPLHCEAYLDGDDEGHLLAMPRSFYRCRTLTRDGAFLAVFEVLYLPTPMDVEHITNLLVGLSQLASPYMSSYTLSILVFCISFFCFSMFIPVKHSILVRGVLSSFSIQSIRIIHQHSSVAITA